MKYFTKSKKPIDPGGWDIFLHRWRSNMIASASPETYSRFILSPGGYVSKITDRRGKLWHFIKLNFSCLDTVTKREIFNLQLSNAALKLRFFRLECFNVPLNLELAQLQIKIRRFFHQMSKCFRAYRPRSAPRATPQNLKTPNRFVARVRSNDPVQPPARKKPE